MNKVIIILGKPEPDKEDWPDNWANDNFCSGYQKVYFIKIEDQDYINKIKKKVNCNSGNEFCIAMHCNDDDEKVSAVRKIFSSSPNSSYHIYCYSTGDSTRFGPVKNLINAVKNNSWEVAFNSLWDHCVKTDEKKKINEILQLFLPLDIDMQALADLKKNPEIDKKIDYLIKTPKGLNEPSGMLRDKVNYEDKLDKAIKAIDKIKELKNNDICELRKKLEEKKCFLKMLDDMRKAIESKNEDSDEKNAIEQYIKDDNHSFWKNVTSFHGWYCELAGELRKLTP